jgi:hypothetical protein
MVTGKQENASSFLAGCAFGAAVGNKTVSPEEAPSKGWLANIVPNNFWRDH